MYGVKEQKALMYDIAWHLHRLFSSKILKKLKLHEGMLTLGHSLAVVSITVWNAQWQECEVASHIASAVRKQREMDAGAQFPFSSSLSLCLHLREQSCPHSRWIPVVAYKKMAPKGNGAN